MVLNTFYLSMSVQSNFSSCPETCGINIDPQAVKVKNPLRMA